jgi:hypothetical protein
VNPRKKSIDVTLPDAGELTVCAFVSIFILLVIVFSCLKYMIFFLRDHNKSIKLLILFRNKQIFFNPLFYD